MGSKVVSIAFPTSFSAVSTTMMPFLYQTRTLAGVHWPREALASALRSRSFITSTQHYVYHQINAPNGNKTKHIADDSNDANGRPLIRRVSHVHASSGSPRADPKKSISWEYNPRETTRRSNHFSIREDEDADMELDSMESTYWDEQAEGLFDNANEIEDLTRNVPEPSKAGESTITMSERRAFQRIFSDILERSKGLPQYDDILEESDRPLRSFGREKARESANRIIGMSAAGAEGSRRTHRSMAEMEQTVNRFPPSLRAAAARSFGVSRHERDSGKATAETEVEMDTDQLEHLREPERQRVEAIMRAAKTDFELWEIMEKEVFTLIAKLGLEETPEEEVIPGVNRGKKRKKATKKNESSSDSVTGETAAESLALDETGRDSTSTQDGSLVATRDGTSLALYGPLYPSYLLLGLRLLDRSFSKPSPLTLSLLPRIKSLGLISHVLGASTPLYNELLRIYWFDYENFTGVLNLLTEMEEAGLDQDVKTLGIINDILQQQIRVRRGDKGATLKTLWSLPEFHNSPFKTNKFLVWRRKIQQAIAERGQDFSAYSSE